MSDLKKLRINRLPREAAAIIILRRKNQSINNISYFLGRSTSFVYRILKNFRKIDLRKLPRRIILLAARRNRVLLEKLRLRWQDFIIGESERPP